MGNHKRKIKTQKFKWKRKNPTLTTKEKICSEKQQLENKFLGHLNISNILDGFSLNAHGIQYAKYVICLVIFGASKNMKNLAMKSNVLKTTRPLLKTSTKTNG